MSLPVWSSVGRLPLTDRVRRTPALVAFVLAGMWLYAWSGQNRAVTISDVITALGVAVVASLPAMAEILSRLSARLRDLPPRRHACFVAVMALLVCGHFLFAAYRGGRQWVPFLHDEQMYLLQARMLASGHVAMPPHPMGEFFDTFYILMKPVYASMYFPGTALAYVPALWMRLPWVAWPLLITTSLVVMTYVVGARLLGRPTALVAAVCLLGVDPMNFCPTMTLSHPLGALQGLAAVYGWLRWRERPAAGWAVLCGVAGGWMGVTRPMESLAFGLPLAVAVLAAGPRVGWRRLALHGLAAALAATPFLSLQLACNKQITGHWTELPITLYTRQEFPGLSNRGTGSMDQVYSTSTLAQKQEMVNIFMRPRLNLHAKETGVHALSWRVRDVLQTGLSHPLMMLLLPLALPLAWSDPRWRLVLAVPVLFCLAYLSYPIYLNQYTIQIAPLLIYLQVGGVLWLAQAYTDRPARVRAVYLLPVLALGAKTLHDMPNNAFEGTGWQQMTFNYRELPEHVKVPALVLNTFPAGRGVGHVEPVYNIDVAWPDDAPIIRAHDFGAARDLPLLEYYARLQPNREVYRFDRGTWRVIDLGNVATLARELREHMTPGATLPATSSTTQPFAP